MPQAGNRQLIRRRLEVPRANSGRHSERENRTMHVTDYLILKVNCLVRAIGRRSTQDTIL